MKIKKICTGFIIIIFLLGFISSNIDTEDYNVFARDKINSQLLQEIEDNPEDILEVVVSANADTDVIESYLSKIGAEITSKYDFINTYIVKMKAIKIFELATLDNVVFINKEASASTSNTYSDEKSIRNVYNKATNVDKVWAKGYKGEDITIAVIDSGIYHKEDSDFGSRVIKDIRIDNYSRYPVDEYGHGTHISGIIAGNGKASGGKYIGVAPRANLINIDISNSKGIASEKNLLDALQWIYKNHKRYNIKVVNISMNLSTTQSYNKSPVCAAVEILWNSGVVVVASAGNSDNKAAHIPTAPANDPYVITVGSVDDNGTASIDDDFMKSWSCRGTTIDGIYKPDLVAPGSKIISYMPKGNLREIAPENILESNYFKMGGTSVSAPIVTGIVALMIEAHPDWTPDQIKWVLMNTARNYPNQIVGTPGIVTADKAVFYSQEPGYANEGVKPSLLLFAEIDNDDDDDDDEDDEDDYDDDDDDEDYNSSNMTWSNMTWSNMTWSNMTWSNMTWSNMTWSNMTWSNYLND